MKTSGRGSTGNVLAAICSIFIPVLGQLVQGRLLRAFIHFVIIGGFFWFLTWISFGVIPLFWIAHLWSMIDAALWKGDPQRA
ncbi:MAG: hypothetical protein AAF514_17195 [Verrucomicrobiota bacterium]